MEEAGRMGKPLRLLAQDQDDVPVISALVQDAVVRPAEVCLDARARRFVVLMNRFRWEEADEEPRRVRTALRIEGVMKAARKGWPAAADKDAVLELLALTVTPGEEGAATLELDFAGPAAVRLDVECIEVLLEDLTEPWPARAKPVHKA